MSIFYSASSRGFYSVDINGSNIPDDAVEVQLEAYEELLAGQSEGKVIVPTEDGSPQLIDSPPPTADELKLQAVSMRDALLAVAALRIAPLQDAVDLGEETEEEVAALKLWKQYRVAVNRVDVTQADPAWPAQPE